MNSIPLKNNLLPASESHPNPKQNDAELQEACQQFESLLIQQLISSMRQTAIKSDLVGHSNEDDMYNSMLDQEMAKTMAHQGGFGLANLLFEQLHGKSASKG